MAGYDSTVYLRNAYLKTVTDVIVSRTVFSNINLFPRVTNVGGGSTIPFMIDYSTTSNAGTFQAVTTAFPSSDDMDSIGAYQTKDYHQDMVQTWDILNHQINGGANGSLVEGYSYEGTAAHNSAMNLASQIADVYVADLKALIDSAGNFSDAALLRSTYGLASSEQATVGASALADYDAAIADLKSATYGRAQNSDLFWLMDSVNVARLAALTPTPLGSSADLSSPIDAEKAHRVQTYGGIPIFIEDSIGSADVFLLRKGTIGIYEHMPLNFVPVAKTEHSTKEVLLSGSNLIVTNPTFNAKLSGITS